MAETLVVLNLTCIGLAELSYRWLIEEPFFRQGASLGPIEE